MPSKGGGRKHMITINIKDNPIINLTNLIQGEWSKKFAYILSQYFETISGFIC